MNQSEPTSSVCPRRRLSARNATITSRPPTARRTSARAPRTCTKADRQRARPTPIQASTTLRLATPASRSESRGQDPRLGGSHGPDCDQASGERGRQGRQVPERGSQQARGGLGEHGQRGPDAPLRQRDADANTASVAQNLPPSVGTEPHDCQPPSTIEQISESANQFGEGSRVIAESSQTLASGTQEQSSARAAGHGVDRGAEPLGRERQGQRPRRRQAGQGNQPVWPSKAARPCRSRSRPWS